MRGDPASRPRDLAQLPRLTGLRAVAALVVFAHHAQLYGGWPELRFLEAGYLGVSLFFVLSGFVLTWAARPGDSARRFWSRRFARIYPAYLVGVALAVVLVDRPPLGPLLANLALVQAWVPDLDYSFGVSSPNWSLSCEAFFYALFPFVAWRVAALAPGRALRLLAGWWLVTNAATVALSTVSADVAYMAYADPLLRSGEFALGILGALALQRGWRPPLAPGAAIALVVGLTAVGWKLKPPFPCLGVMLGPAFALLIVAAASADRAGSRDWLSSRALVYGGQISYCFYLVHLSVIDRHVGPVLPRGAHVAVSLVVAVALAAALHHAVERPFQRRLSGRPAERAPAI